MTMYERTRFGGIAIGDQVVIAVTHSTFLGQSGTVKIGVKPP